MTKSKLLSVYWRFYIIFFDHEKNKENETKWQAFFSITQNLISAFSTTQYILRVQETWTFPIKTFNRTNREIDDGRSSSGGIHRKTYLRMIISRVRVKQAYFWNQAPRFTLVILIPCVDFRYNYQEKIATICNKNKHRWYTT